MAAFSNTSLGRMVFRYLPESRCKQQRLQPSHLSVQLRLQLQLSGRAKAPADIQRHGRMRKIIIRKQKPHYSENKTCWVWSEGVEWLCFWKRQFNVSRIVFVKPANFLNLFFPSFNLHQGSQILVTRGRVLVSLGKKSLDKNCGMVSSLFVFFCKIRFEKCNKLVSFRSIGQWLVCLEQALLLFWASAQRKQAQRAVKTIRAKRVKLADHMKTEALNQV